MPLSSIYHLKLGDDLNLRSPTPELEDTTKVSWKKTQQSRA